MSEWKIVTLGKVADVRDGTHDSPKQQDEGEYLITSRHIKAGNIDFSSAYKISLVDYEEVNRRSKVHKWDVLFSMIGTIGEMAIIDFEPNFAIKNIGLFKTNGDKNLAKWIYYYFKSDEAKAEIDASLKGSTQQYITLEDLRRFPVVIPPLPEQKAIVGVFSSLDDRIDLLHRQNKTLEAMAEALFRQWFVEEADETWEEKPLNDIIDISIGRTPPRQEFHWFSKNPNDVKWISIKDLGMSGIFVFDTAEKLTREAVERFNIPVIPKDTVVLSFKMTVGRVGIATEEMLSNEAIAHFIFNSGTPFIIKEYLYFYLKNFNYDSLGSTSSIVTAINSSMIKELIIKIPPKQIMVNFKEIVENQFEKIKRNQIQIRTLEKLRDTLLPKLMSGEVRVTV